MTTPEELKVHTNLIDAHITVGSDIPLDTMLYFVRDSRVLADILQMYPDSTKRMRVEALNGAEARDRYDDLTVVAATGLRHFRLEHYAENYLSPQNRVVASSSRVVSNIGARATHRRKG